ncbi:MAG: tryptophan 2,3-dioxygenase family protein [Pseudomonadales bacterium]
MKTGEALTYSGYLALDCILSAQSPRSSGTTGESEHDELLFIIIHQVFELWFKQLLHELDYLCKQVREGNHTISVHILVRARNIVKVMVSQIDVLETMTPLEFGTFRDRLDQASGLQSFQFRELEFLLGKKRKEVLARYQDDNTIYKRLELRLNAPTLWDAFLAYLEGRGYDIPAEVMKRDVSVEAQASDAVVTVLETVYRNDPEAMQLCELLTDLDEGLQEWRYRHVKMVERTIGTKGGTGGSAGAEYLKSTLNRPAFPELWLVRSRL